jgi:hypothetical protein
MFARKAATQPFVRSGPAAGRFTNSGLYRRNGKRAQALEL